MCLFSSRSPAASCSLHSRLTAWPVHLPATDAVAGYMFNNSANGANAALLAEQANVMLTACNAAAVPMPPVSFNPITACVNTVRAARDGDAVPSRGAHLLEDID